MSEFKKYPSIGKFKDIVASVKKANKRTFSHLEVIDGVKTPIFKGADLPTLTFQGTVKLHGTNACVVVNSDHSMDAQSRTRILSLTSDNAGFCSWFVGKQDLILSKVKHLIDDIDILSLHIYGEWCGGNIQAGVALNGLEKHFVVFGILVTRTMDNKEVWLPKGDLKLLTDKENNIYSITDFPTYEVTVDMNNPQEGLDAFDKLRDEIDAVCPVAKALGSTSDSTVGEGNVWRCITEGYETLSFKHKGEAHTRKCKKPKQQKLAEPLTEDQQKNYDEFLKEACTGDRLMQGIEFLREQGVEVSQKNTGAYLKWVTGDVQKECKVELEALLVSGVTWKQVVKPLSQMAREVFFAELEKL